jgi:hypothetical protein
MDPSDDANDLEELDALYELEAELLDATDEWTSATLVRTFPANDEGDEAFEDELVVLTAHGYEAAMQTSEDSHIHVGRLLLTGGLSVFAGRQGIRSEGRTTVTFRRRAVVDVPRPTGGLVAELERLARLRAAGHLSDEEFAAAKGAILGRK